MFSVIVVHVKWCVIWCCSLNRERRMREMMRVAEENQQMLKRIESVRPKYSNAKWEREWQANLQLIDQMSAYPPEWWKYQDQVPVKLSVLECALYSGLDFSSVGLDVQLHHHQLSSSVTEAWHDMALHFNLSSAILIFLCSTTFYVIDPQLPASSLHFSTIHFTLTITTKFSKHWLFFFRKLTAYTIIMLIFAVTAG